MKVLIDNTKALQKCVTLKINHNIIENAIHNKLRTIAKKIRIDGFRLGKAPIKIVTQRYSSSVRQDIINEFMQRIFIDRLTKEQWHPSSSPVYKLHQNTCGQDVIFSVLFDVYPCIELKGLENIEIEKPIIKITETDIDMMLYMLRQQKAVWKETNETAAIHDRVTLDFTSSIKNEDFIGDKALDINLVIGSGRMPASFEKGIIGHKAGENFMIDVTFPIDYKNLYLQDKKVQFKVVLKKVERCHLPELTTEFIQQFGIKEGSLNTLRTELHKNMQRELNNAMRRFMKLQVINGLLTANNIEIPQNIVNSNIDLLKLQQTHRCSDNTIITNSKTPHELYVEKTQRHILIDLIFKTVIHSYDIKTDENRVHALIEELASAYEDQEEVISLYKSNSELMQQMRNIALEAQAVEEVLLRVKLTEKFITFHQFMHLSFTH
ncbi:trigger factor [Candidatus Erwinia haradaeae]|uniref:Trigger factor n=1 Tax=Candidatus Erwinia haradaeae TaxID=1922217 RepID=A0A451DA91_9GAMM|nr:trigger factor [Candidatus Erwinia haradaeae]VFP83235.1 Trigger factor [Candidatus Erwinia haradaeae]